MLNVSDGNNGVSVQISDFTACPILFFDILVCNLSVFLQSVL